MDRLSWLLEGLASGLPAIAASLLFVAFGVAAGLLLGVRSWLLAFATAAPIGIALLISSAQLVGSIGLLMSTVAYVPVALALAGVMGVAIEMLLGKRASMACWKFSHVPALVWAGAALGMFIALGAWLAGIGNFHVPPQANDDIWHGYLVERLTHMSSVTASTVAPTLVDSSTPIVFYQYGLHLAGAVIHEATGITVAETLNGMWTVYVGLLTPFGVAALAWHLFPERRWVAVWSGAFSSGIAVFPYATNGILPYTAALAMGPGLLALLVAHLRGDRESSAVAVAACAVGIFTTHPSAAAALAVIAALITAEHLFVQRRVRKAVLMRVGTVAACAVVWALPWLLAARTREIGESPQAAVFALRDAVWMTIGLGSPWSPQQPIVAALAAIGLVQTLSARRAIALSLSVSAFAALFVGIAVGGRWAAELTLAWHANWYRVLAVVGLLVPVLAALGADRLVLFGMNVFNKSSMRPVRGRAMAGVSAIVVVVVIAIGHGAGHGQSIVRAAWHDPNLVTTEDISLFDALSKRLGPDARVFNSPRDGSGWMYALSGVTPIQPYVYGRPRSLAALLAGSGRYARASSACRWLRDMDATHAFVKTVRGDISDEAYDVGGFVERHPQLFVEVTRSGTAIAYEIDQEALTECVAG